jgi:hypothetical protein
MSFKNKKHILPLSKKNQKPAHMNNKRKKKKQKPKKIYQIFMEM